MSEHDLYQLIIAFTWLVSTILLATNRYIVGCFVVLSGLPAWWLSAGDQWGFKVVVGTMATVYTLGIIGRRKRRPKLLSRPAVNHPDRIDPYAEEQKAFLDTDELPEAFDKGTK